MHKIYAIYDTVAKAPVGGLHLHAHDASAIRTFGDIANTSGSLLNLHPDDYQLVHIGTLVADEWEFDSFSYPIVPEFRVVLTGAQWAASQNPDMPNNG